MKNFQEFCDGVLKEMPRATQAERSDIRDELTDHFLEHKDLLMNYGVEAEEAERRAIAAMGDPEEIGRAWNEKLSPFWLWLERICAAAFLLVLLFNGFDIYDRVEQVGDALEIRYAVDAGTRIDPMKGCELLWAEDPGVEEAFGEHIIRIHRAELWEDEYMGEPFYILKLYYVSHHQSLLGKSLDSSAFFGLEYEGAQQRSGGSTETAYGTWVEHQLRVERGRKTVGMTLDYHGSHFEAEVELDWGGEVA